MTSALSVLLEEFALDGSFARFGLLATTPVIFCVSIVRSLLLVCIEGAYDVSLSSSVYNSSVTSA